MGWAVWEGTGEEEDGGGGNYLIEKIVPDATDDAVVALKGGSVVRPMCFTGNQQASILSTQSIRMSRTSNYQQIT
jgi:hypothetical protein